jgi:hypothetical protein
MPSGDEWYLRLVYFRYEIYPQQIQQLSTQLRVHLYASMYIYEFVQKTASKSINSL